MKIEDILNSPKISYTIYKTVMTMAAKLHEYRRPVCSVSGGGDSDIMVDLCVMCDKDHKVKYVFYDTGLEYQATRRHLDYLEERYGIEIERVRSYKSVPKAVRDHGVPFISKTHAELIGRLQKHGFQWEDESFDELSEKYPNCKSGLKWWTNSYPEGSRFNIQRDRALKTFLMKVKPEFQISSSCCTYAKKKTSKRFNKEYGTDLTIIGVRRAEGGVRATKYSSCFSVGDDCDHYRPLFFWTDEDKEIYNRLADIKNSDCYEVWGFKRTGCAGCPFNSHWKEELETIEKYEPQMAKACRKVFGDAYALDEEWKSYRSEWKRKNRKK